MPLPVAKRTSYRGFEFVYNVPRVLYSRHDAPGLHELAIRRADGGQVDCILYWPGEERQVLRKARHRIDRWEPSFPSLFR